MSCRTCLLAGAGAAIVASVVATATYSALSATTVSSANSYAAGSVTLVDNDGGARMLSLTNATPGSSATGCILVTYNGSLNATVRLYGTVTGLLGPYLTLTVTRGTDLAPSFGSCAAFTADATNYIGAGLGVIYSGLLSAFPSSYTTGIVDPTSGAPETWISAEAHSYKFVISLNNDGGAQGLSSAATFTWEARNQ
jgi:hypothetical protein